MLPKIWLKQDPHVVFSELIINENQSFASEQLRENDTMANVKQTSERDNSNSERLISYQGKDPDIDVHAVQGKIANKKKKNSKVDISQKQ